MELSAGMVVGRTTARNKDGNLPVRILQVMITDLNDVQNVQLVGQAGEECNPPDGSLVLVNACGQAFKLSAGTADTIEPVLAVGGKRIYSTNAENDTVMAECRLDPDGKIAVSNVNATVTIMPNGLLTVENAHASITIAADGTVTVDSGAKETHITASKVKITAPVEMTSTLAVTGNISANDVVLGGVYQKGHVHYAVDFDQNTLGPANP